MGGNNFSTLNGFRKEILFILCFLRENIDIITHNMLKTVVNMARI